MLCWIQVFLDIVEEVNVLLNSRGEVLSSHVVGRLVMKALLTGMPDIKIGLNDKVEVRDDTMGGAVVLQSRQVLAVEHTVLQGRCTTWMHGVCK
jgi:Adaptor complexes medium subunit family